LKPNHSILIEIAVLEIAVVTGKCFLFNWAATGSADHHTEGEAVPDRGRQENPGPLCG
jgi:hypothetical protein